MPADTTPDLPASDLPARVYGRPFPKGTSGHPAGRPRGAALSPGERALRRRIKVEVDGRTRRYSVFDLMLLRLGEKAAQGDIAAARELRKAALDGAALRAHEATIRAAQEARDRPPPPPPGPVIRPMMLRYSDRNDLTPQFTDLDACVVNNGKTFLRRWVIEQSLTRQPELKETLSNFQWTSIREATEEIGVGWEEEDGD